MNAFARAPRQRQNRPQAAKTVRPPQRPSVGNQALLRRLQAKLAIGPIDDPLEREADAIADQAMRGPAPGGALAAGGARVQRKCAACEEEEKPTAQRKAGADAGSAGGSAPPSVQAALAGSGAPLDAATRGFMETRLGADFGGVRVHDDAKATRSAREMAALAYTVGEHIAFGEGAYRPDEERGRLLLAHELAHVVQQRGGAPGVQRQAAPPPPVALGGLAAFEILRGIMCRNATMRAVFERIQTDGVKIVLFQTGYDVWEYDDGHTEVEDLTGLRGNTDLDERTIRLRDSLPPETMAETLFHEMQHWGHYQDPAGPRDLESEVQARIATERLAIDRGRPATGPNYRTADGRVNEAEIRRAMAVSPHYSPVGRQRTDRYYVGEKPVPGPFLCLIGDFPTPSRERAVV